MCIVIKTVCLHTPQKLTLRDIYLKRLKLKLSRPRNEVDFPVTHSTLDKNVYFVVSIVAQPDPKNPSRWRRVIQCRTAV